MRVPGRVANCEGVSERDPAEEAVLAMTKPGVFGRPKIIFLSEVSWLRVAPLAEEHGYHSLQFGERGSPEAGVALLSTEPFAAALIKEGSEAGRGLRMRPTVTGFTFGEWWTAGHAPPGRNPIEQLAYMRHLKEQPGIIGADFNKTPRIMRHDFKRQYRGIEVLGVLAPKDIKVSSAHRVGIRSDHKAVDVLFHLSNVDTQRREGKDAA